MKAVIPFASEEESCVAWIKWLYLLNDGEIGELSEITGTLAFSPISANSFVSSNELPPMMIASTPSACSRSTAVSFRKIVSEWWDRGESVDGECYQKRERGEALPESLWLRERLLFCNHCWWRKNRKAPLKQSFSLSSPPRNPNSKPIRPGSELVRDRIRSLPERHRFDLKRNRWREAEQEEMRLPVLGFEFQTSPLKKKSFRLERKRHTLIIYFIILVPFYFIWPILSQPMPCFVFPLKKKNIM